MAFVARARLVLASSREAYRDGGLLVERGRVLRLLGSARAVARAARTARLVDFGDATLTPGWINAHTHLDLSGLEGRLPRGPDFVAWIRALLGARGERTPTRLARDAVDGARRALESGTTTVVDIDSSGACERVLGSIPLRIWTCREALDAQDPARTRAVVARLARALPRRARRSEALSPHAPFSVSPALFDALGRIARRRGLPLVMHWAETQAETQWLRRGDGPLSGLLGPSPHVSGLDLLERAGLLRAPLALVHGNDPRRGEIERLARVGAVVVHCPGSHAWFEREPFPWRAYRAHGVTLALGTDSLASNDGLDLGAEMQRLRAVAPSLSPAEVFDMATIGGAQAVGAQGRLGVLRAGAAADWVVLGGLEPNLRDALDALTQAEGELRAVWIAGRAVWRPRGGAPGTLARAPAAAKR